MSLFRNVSFQKFLSQFTLCWTNNSLDCYQCNHFFKQKEKKKKQIKNIYSKYREGNPLK